MAVQYGNMPTGQMRVFYTGTDELKTGYALCFDGDTILNDNGLAYDPVNVVTAANRARLFNVEKPGAANANMWNFAGVVDQESDGVTGPADVVINLPGFPAQVLVAFTTVINATTCTLVDDEYYFIEGGWPGAGSARNLQTVTGTTGTPVLCQALLETGPQSGGYGDVTPLTGADLSAADIIVLNRCGVVKFLPVTIAANAVPRLADGTWNGRRFLCFCGTITTSVVELDVTSHAAPGVVATAGVNGEETVFMSVAGEGFSAVWEEHLDVWQGLAFTADVT